MDVVKFLREISALPGTPGYEGPVAEYVKTAFEAVGAEDVSLDRLGNVYARWGASGPRVMLMAHQDEIGLVVRNIEEDGCLRVMRTGGVDPRILPAARVWVMAKDGPLLGVVGAKPPHLLSEAERGKAIRLEDVFIDVGYAPERVRDLVRVGDQVVFDAPLAELANGRLAGKTMDDRACIAVMLACAEQLKRLRAQVEAAFVSSVQEEIGSWGARVATYRFAPDVAVVLDVTHGESPDTQPFTAYPLDKPTLAMGPNIHPTLLAEIRETAKRNHVEYVLEPVGGVTATDAEETQVSREGVPSLLLSVPLRYMHTSVELLSAEVIEESGRLLALFLCDIARKWEELTWY